MRIFSFEIKCTSRSHLAIPTDKKNFGPRASPKRTAEVRSDGWFWPKKETLGPLIWMVGLIFLCVWHEMSPGTRPFWCDHFYSIGCYIGGVINDLVPKIVGFGKKNVVLGHLILVLGLRSWCIWHKNLPGTRPVWCDHLFSIACYIGGVINDLVPKIAIFWLLKPDISSSDLNGGSQIFMYMTWNMPLDETFLMWPFIFY